MTLKDHKDNFVNKPTCRLINPSKQEIGKISKKILERINQKLVNATNVNQWKNTPSVLQWYKKLSDKSNSAFISFDVVEFYPSISETLLNRALDFASNHLSISADDRQTILHHRQKCGSFESAITMSCGRLTMEANGKITKKVYGDWNIWWNISWRISKCEIVQAKQDRLVH